MRCRCMMTLVLSPVKSRRSDGARKVYVKSFETSRPSNLDAGASFVSAIAPIAWSHQHGPTERDVTYLGHPLTAELELDDLDVFGRVDLDVVLAFRKLALQGRAETRHVVRLAVYEDQVRRHHLVDELGVLRVVDVRREGDVLDGPAMHRSAVPQRMQDRDAQSSNDLAARERLDLGRLVHDRLSACQSRILLQIEYVPVP